jgi:hypothetical protein
MNSPTLSQKARADANRRDNHDQILRLAGVPSLAMAVARAASIDTVAIVAVRESQDTILTLAGAPGTGKTVAAARSFDDYVAAESNWKFGESHMMMSDGWAWEYHWQGGNIVWTSAAALSRIDRFSATAVRDICAADRLVIDDLGSEYVDGKGFFLALFDEIIDARYANLRKTILTTNLTPDSFRQRYQERIVDRIRQRGRFVNCGSVSLRRPTP